MLDIRRIEYSATSRNHTEFKIGVIEFHVFEEGGYRYDFNRKYMEPFLTVQRYISDTYNTHTNEVMELVNQAIYMSKYASESQESV